MTEEKRLHGAAKEEQDKVSKNLANVQGSKQKFQVGELVRVKNDGAVLPIEDIDETNPKKVLYWVGGFCQDEGDIEKLPSQGTPTKSTCESGAPALMASDSPQPDFSLTDNPEENPNVGLFTVKSANQVIDEAKNRPVPSKLFGQLWFEHEVCILFADTNVGKSILAVQIADGISKGCNIMGLEMGAAPQLVLYFDFELSDKQFELRYIGVGGNHYKFSDNFKRVEVNPDVVDYPDGFDFEDYVKQSLEDAVLQYGAKIIIIDNLTYLSRETEKARDALPLMKWLKALGRKYNLSILVLAHTPKRDLSKPLNRNDLSGSKMLINFCDGCFAIGESTKDKTVRYIKEIKQRNVSVAYDGDNVIVCEICKPDDFLQFRFIGYGYESEHLRQIGDTERAALIDRAKDLSRKGKSQREIATELGISPASVNKYLKKK